MATATPVSVSEILPPRVPDDRRPVDDDRLTAERAHAPNGPTASDADGPDVGHPRSATMTAVMLSQYLVGRAIAQRVSAALLIGGLGTILVAVGLWFWVSHVLAVVVGIVGLAILAFRAVVMRILGALMGVGRFGAAEQKIRALVSDTGSDLRRELRRIGLPGSTLGLPVLIVRLLGRRRRATLARLSEFRVANVVPASRMNELNFVVRNDVLGR